MVFCRRAVERKLLHCFYNVAMLEKINTLDLGFSHSGVYVGSVNETCITVVSVVPDINLVEIR